MKQLEDMVNSIKNDPQYQRALARAVESDTTLYIPMNQENICLLKVPEQGMGFGLMDTVMRGHHGEVIKVVTEQGVFALKFIVMHEVSDLLRFNHEWLALQALGLLQGVEEPCEVGGTGKFVMPYYDGITLEEQRLQWLWNSKDATQEVVIEIGQLIIKALREVHARGYAHQSLLPRNIIIACKDKQWSVFLIDFGRSRSFESFPDTDERFTDIHNLKRTFKQLFSHMLEDDKPETNNLAKALVPCAADFYRNEREKHLKSWDELLSQYRSTSPNVVSFAADRTEAPGSSAENRAKPT